MRRVDPFRLSESDACHVVSHPEEYDAPTVKLAHLRRIYPPIYEAWMEHIVRPIH